MFNENDWDVINKRENDLIEHSKEYDISNKQ